MRENCTSGSVRGAPGNGRSYRERPEGGDMKLSPADKAFVERREKRGKSWPWLGVIALAMVAAYGVWLWVKMPQLINPWWVSERIEAGTLSESTMGVMAVMLPFVMAAFVAFLFIVVLLWFIPFFHERRLIQMVRRLEAGQESGEENGQKEGSKEP
jgi:hypothetical protein